MEKHSAAPLRKDIRSIIILLATQSMINLGEVKDPIRQETVVNLPGALVFIELLEVLQEKTHGNLASDEAEFLAGVIDNLKQVYARRSVN
jgi:hypothetical protein